MTLAVSGMLVMDAKVQYIHMLVRGEALCKFDLMSDDGRVRRYEPFNSGSYYFRILCILPPCEFYIKSKACNATQNEESAQIKSKAI